MKLAPTYLPFADGHNHAFVLRLRKFAQTAGKGSVLVLQAPTGAGKTRAVMSLAAEQDTLLTVPTNALAAEIEETYRREFSPSVARWNADAFTRHNRARHEEMIVQAFGNSLVVSNPDLLHLLTQHEYRRDGRLRSFHDGMSAFRLAVFDEYHAYDERVLASILLYVLKMRAARGNQQRFLFLSATPDEALPRALDALGIEHELVAAEIPTTRPLSPPHGRRVRGEIQLEVSTKPILSALPSRPPRQRSLFIFSTFLDQQIAVRTLRAAGMKEDDSPQGFVQITGRATSSRRGQMTWGSTNLMLATSKVDVGLNIPDLHHVFMEPGWTEQQFWQRFGRAGRGRPCYVQLHFPGASDEPLRALRDATDTDEIQNAIRGLLRSSHTHVDTILRFIGAYGASYRDNTPPSADRDLFTSDGSHPKVREGYGCVATILHGWRDDEFRDSPAGAIQWRDTVKAALKGLRGRALRTPTVYVWSSDDQGENVVQEDVVYVLCRTDAPQADADGVHRVREILVRAKDAYLTYQVLDDTIRVPVRGTLRRKAFSELPRRMEHAIGEASSDGSIPPFWKALIAWLRMVPSDEIAPREVILDDYFL